MPPPVTPVKIGQDRYVSFSMGALWAIAGAMLVGLGLLCEGIHQGQQFIDSFSEFKKTTLAYQQATEYHDRVTDVKLANISSWQLAADERRKINFPTLVNVSSLDEWGRALERANADVAHGAPDAAGKRGLIVPSIVVKPLENLPEAIILPLPAPPVSGFGSREN